MKPCANKYCETRNLCTEKPLEGCLDYVSVRTFKHFGYDVTVRFHDGHTETFHWRGLTEGAARRKGMMKILAREIVSITPVTEQEWINAYGIGRM